MKSPYLHKAVTVAYENLVQAEHCPPYFLFFETDPSLIDVNIHPTKTEIKFEDERSVWKIVSAAVRESLGKFNMVPSIDFDQTDEISIPTFRKDDPVSVPSVSINPDYNPFDMDKPQPASSHQATPVSSNWESLYEGFETGGEEDWRDDEPETVILPSKENIEDEGEQQIIPSGTSSEKNETGTLYFQIKNKYIITSVKSGIMIIDQRRAHERILFEDFLKNIQAGASVSQQSLFPEEISFNEEDAILLRDIHEDLRVFGFELQEKSDRTFAVTGQPSFIKNINAPRLIDAILEAFKSGEVDPENEIKEQLATIMAQNACMRPGEFLTQPEMAELINKLFLCSAPNFTPGGKTVFSILDNEELEKRFR